MPKQTLASLADFSIHHVDLYSLVSMKECIVKNGGIIPKNIRTKQGLATLLQEMQALQGHQNKKVEQQIKDHLQLVSHDKTVLKKCDENMEQIHDLTERYKQADAN